MTLEELIAKQQITEVIYRYCRGVDRLDRELVRECYWPDATDEHGSFTGLRDDYIAWVFDRLLPRNKWSQHFVANILIDVDLANDYAKSEAYGQSRHQHATSDKIEHNLVTGFRYIDDFERRHGEWRIARRICTVEFVRKDAVENWFEAGPSHRRGTRDRTDPVYWGRHDYLAWEG